MHPKFQVTCKTTSNNLCVKLKTEQCLGENALQTGCCQGFPH